MTDQTPTRTAPTAFDRAILWAAAAMVISAVGIVAGHL